MAIRLAVVVVAGAVTVLIELIVSVFVVDTRSTQSIDGRYIVKEKTLSWTTGMS